MEGKLTPEQFGRVTLWQMVNVYGFGKRAAADKSIKDRYFERMRHLGYRESEIYESWRKRQRQLTPKTKTKTKPPKTKTRTKPKTKPKTKTHAKRRRDN